MNEIETGIKNICVFPKKKKRKKWRNYFGKYAPPNEILSTKP